jgi:hypothetical protein
MLAPLSFISTSSLNEGLGHVDGILLWWVTRLSRPDPLNLPRIGVTAKRIADAAGAAIDNCAREIVADVPTIADRWIGAVRSALIKRPYISTVDDAAAIELLRDFPIEHVRT